MSACVRASVCARACLVVTSFGFLSECPRNSGYIMHGVLFKGHHAKHLSPILTTGLESRWKAPIPPPPPPACERGNTTESNLLWDTEETLHITQQLYATAVWPAKRFLYSKRAQRVACRRRTMWLATDFVQEVEPITVQLQFELTASSSFPSSGSWVICVRGTHFTL